MDTLFSLQGCRNSGPSLWKRWLALLSLALLVFVPQAHMVLQHGLALPSSHAAQTVAAPVPGSHAQVSDDDSPCTLCSVLGSVTQLAIFQTGRPLEDSVKLRPATKPLFAKVRWCHDQFSRPPPDAKPASYAG